MRNNLRNVQASLSMVDSEKQNNESFLEKVNNLFVQGRCSRNKKRKAYFNEGSATPNKIYKSSLFIPTSSSCLSRPLSINSTTKKTFSKGKYVC